MSDTNNFSIRGANDFGQDDADRNQNHNPKTSSDEKHSSSSSSSSNPYVPTHAATDFYHNANPGGPTTNRNQDANQARRVDRNSADRKGGSQADKEGEGKKSIAGKIKEYIKPARD